MASSSTIVGPMAPLPNKRGQGPVGSDLIVTYHSDLAQCEILPSGARYTSAGNFKAGTFLTFHPPDFVSNVCPHLFSTDDGEKAGIPLVLSMFNAGARAATLEQDWEEKWFTIIARICPNKLTFYGVRLDGWEDDSHDAQVALALPRDEGLTPIVPRLLSTSDTSTAWPNVSPHASFAGPVDLDTFRLKDDAYPEAWKNTSVFVKLGSYILPEDDRPPHKGVHTYHVLLIFPTEQQPWSSLLGWMRQASNPFPRGSWITCSGRVLGVLNRALLQGPPVDTAVRILVVLPDDWEFIRQSSLGTHSPSMASITSNVNERTPPSRPPGPGGVSSQNPFSSPNRFQHQSPGKKLASQTVPPKQQSTNIAATDTVIAVLTSDDDITDAGSDVDQMVDDQLASTDTTPSRKRKSPDCPEPGRRKRTTAGQRRPQLYD